MYNRVSIKGFPNYSVDNQGKVWSGISNLKPVKQHLTTKGFLNVCLIKEGAFIWKYVANLVAEAFVRNPNKHKYVLHKDGDITNNEADNLEWCTYKQMIESYGE